MSGKPLYTKEQLITMLKDLNNKTGKTPKQKDLSKFGLPSSNTFVSYFGSWGNALVEAGFKPNHRIEKYTEEELLSKLNEYYIKYNKIPTTDGLYEVIENGDDFPNPHQYVKFFGSFSNALEKCDFVKYKKEQDIIKKKQFFIVELKRYYSQYGKVPTIRELNKAKDFPKAETIARYFGSFNNAIKEAGLDKFREYKQLPTKKPKYNKDDVKEIFKKFIETNNIIPSYGELKKYNLPSSTTVIKLFGSLNNLIAELGYEIKNATLKVKSNEELIDDLRELYKKLNRTITKKDIENDDNCCSYEVYTKRFGGYYNMLDVAGIPYDKKGKMYSDEEIVQIWYDIVNKNKTYPTREELSKYKILSPIMARWGNYRNFLIDIGIPINKETYGFRVFETKKGTLCYSYYELKITQWLEDKNIRFDKEVFYSDVIQNYNLKQRFRFDWVIDYKDKKYYVEMFGIEKHNKYNEKIKIKLKICKENNINLIPIYPKDFKEKTLDEIFSFLN